MLIHGFSLFNARLLKAFGTPLNAIMLIQAACSVECDHLLNSVNHVSAKIKKVEFANSVAPDETIAPDKKG